MVAAVDSICKKRKKNFLIHSELTETKMLYVSSPKG